MRRIMRVPYSIFGSNIPGARFTDSRQNRTRSPRLSTRPTRLEHVPTQFLGSRMSSPENVKMTTYGACRATSPLIGHPVPALPFLRGRLTLIIDAHSQGHTAEQEEAGTMMDSDRDRAGFEYGRAEHGWIDERSGRTARAASCFPQARAETPDSEVWPPLPAKKARRVDIYPTPYPSAALLRSIDIRNNIPCSSSSTAAYSVPASLVPKGGTRVSVPDYGDLACLHMTPPDAATTAPRTKLT
ncbi:hypothetical protein C8Q77DRAFT_469334 [Trametes polyzona]|nr:hypothetical protein C8Q77DRAFT_469334 [Trametes polyzona]